MLTTFAARGKSPFSGYILPFAICQRPQIELCQLIEFDVDLTWIYALMQLPRNQRNNQISAGNSFQFFGQTSLGARFGCNLLVLVGSSETTLIGILITHLLS